MEEREEKRENVGAVALAYGSVAVGVFLFWIMFAAIPCNISGVFGIDRFSSGISRAGSNEKA